VCYTIIVKGRETLQRTAETVKSTETNLKIGSKKSKKPLDNPLRMCYNDYNEREREAQSPPKKK
jgi:hypothetical protein